MTYFIFSTVQLKCSSEKSKRPEEIFPNVFFTSNAKCVVQPAKNVFGNRYVGSSLQNSGPSFIQLGCSKFKSFHWLLLITINGSSLSMGIFL